jgi:Ca2+-binding EF-hand superfamily protein
MFYVRVVGTTPSKPSSFASTITRMETSLDDVNGVWQKDRGGKFNNYLNVDLEVQDAQGRLIPLDGYIHVEAELRIVMEDGELGGVIDRVDRSSKRVMNKHLEGNNGKLMIIDADPQTGGGLRIGGTSKTTIKTRINELSKKGSRNSRFSVLYRPIGPGSDRFIVDPKLACSRPLTIYSKVVRSAKDEHVNDHLEQAKLAAKTLLSEVEKVDPSTASHREAEVVMEILEACRLIQKKLEWQANRSHTGAKGTTSSIFQAFAKAASQLKDNEDDDESDQKDDDEEEENGNDNAFAPLSAPPNADSRQVSTGSSFFGHDLSLSNSSLMDQPTAASSSSAAYADYSNSNRDLASPNKRQKPHPHQHDWATGKDWSMSKLNVVLNPALDGPEDFSIDFVEEYIRELEQDDGTVNVSTDLTVSDKGITISLFDENMDGKINRDEMAKGIARLDIPLTPEMHKRIFEEFDANKDGVISVQEFIQGVKKKEAELIPLFQQLDKDGDGYLTYEELRSSKLLESASNEEIRELIGFVDALSTEVPDGRISLREFIATFTMLPSGDDLESLTKEISHKRSTGAGSS